MKLVPNTEAQPKDKKRIRRSLLYVNVVDEEDIQKSLTSNTDLVMYDMEDSVPLDLKEVGRDNIIRILNLPRTTNSELGVRINSIGSGHEVEDLKVVLQSDKVQVMLIPKVESPSDIHFVCNMIDLYATEEGKKRIRLIAAIETGLAMMNIKEIAQCSDRLDTLMFAVYDYLISTETTRSPGNPELYYARSLVSNTAHAYGLEAIDMVYEEFEGDDIFREECKQGYRMGFSGKQAINTEQIDIIFDAYCPDSQAIEKAVKTIKDFQNRTQKSLGSQMLDNKVADIPYFKWAERILRRARISGVDVDSLLA
ncbi:hypothetical protein BB558_000135 [Smittium angustum]|uniref:HpcH/HpaI aldolase/citrate lyase domain-containing protein n=1 Tax=Smittium angustum TaxID=133377 RepID=A0A2U1JF23_SMIAN|nr:hypothetical protein BB558_003258 [Smittium angustum]PWA03702.1 hypothetical protein BB558_000135 [Smittium angustum]